jgi:hypothetical protein
VRRETAIPTPPARHGWSGRGILATLRPDLPACLGAALGRAIALDPAERFADMAEFAGEFEAGPSYAPLQVRRPPTLYKRAPARFWQAVAGLLGLALAASLWWK